MPGVDGAQSGQVALTLEDKAKKRRLKIVVFETIGLIAYLLVLYAFYAGFFTALLMIALSVRKNNYLHLNAKLTGHVIPNDYYTTPWIWLRDHLAHSSG